MNTLRNQVALALLGGSLFFGSCRGSHSNEPLPRLHPQTTSSYLQLHLASPNSVTLRSVSEIDPLQQIRNLRFVFYSGETGAEVVSQIKNKTISSSSELENITLALPNGTYKLVVIANASQEAIQATQLGAPLTRLTENQIHRISDFLYYNEHTHGDIFDGICMLNDQGAIDIAPENFQPESTTPPTTPTPTIHLEGTLARILVYGIPTTDGGHTLQKTDLGFNVLNQSKSPSWLRQLGNTAQEGNPLETSQTPIELRYASGALTHTETPANLEDKVSYKTIRESGFAQILENITDNKSNWYYDASFYAKESVVGTNAYLQATAPCVLLRVRYIPGGLTLATDEGWLNIRGNYYRESQVKEWIQNNNYPYPSLQEALSQAQITLDSFTQGFDKAGIKFYYKSYNYYTVYIRHFSDKLAPNANSFGRYGIVRNNEYRVQLQRISGEGSPIQPDLKSALNPIQENQQVKVNISVNPVTPRDQIAEL